MKAAPRKLPLRSVMEDRRASVLKLPATIEFLRVTPSRRPSLLMPPALLRIPVNVLFVIVLLMMVASPPSLAMPPAPPKSAVLPLTVVFSRLSRESEKWFMIPPPELAVLPMTELLISVAVL